MQESDLLAVMGRARDLIQSGRALRSAEAIGDLYAGQAVKLTKGGGRLRAGMSGTIVKVNRLKVVVDLGAVGGWTVPADWVEAI
jgi:hypothetical protein